MAQDVTATQHRALLDQLREFTTETDRYIEVRGGHAGLHRTHLHALAHVMDAERRGAAMTPGRLAAALNLSSPATSALLERLESAGHVVRRPTPGDRRSVTLEATRSARNVGGELFGPLAVALREVLTRYSPAELELVSRFLAEATAATTAARSS